MPPADRILRRVWTVLALIFVASCGAPWSHCGSLGPIRAIADWSATGDGPRRLWALAVALPIVVAAVVGSVQGRARVEAAPRGVLFAVWFATMASGVLHAFAVAPVELNYVAGMRWLVRGLLVGAPLAVGAWGLLRTDSSADRTVLRALAGITAASLPIAWAGACSRLAATVGFAAGCSMLVLAARVADGPASPSAEIRRVGTALALAWIAMAVFAAFHGVASPRFLRWPLAEW